MSLIDHLVCHSLTFANLEVNSFSNYDGNLKRGWQEYSRPFVPEKDSRDLEFIEHQPKTE